MSPPSLSLSLSKTCLVFPPPPPPKKKMEAKLAPETSASLKAEDTTVRFFYRVKFNLDSRQSGPVIAWAESRATAASRAILKQVGRDAGAKVRMLEVHLLRVRRYALLCFDLCLGQQDDDCPKPARPIHEIAERGDAYVVWRSRRLDAKVAAEFARRRELDKGPLPYFVDTMHPPVYDSGVRLEGPGNPELKDESEEEEEEEEQSEEEQKLEDTNPPSKVEEMMDEHVRGKPEVDRPK